MGAERKLRWRPALISDSDGHEDGHSKLSKAFVQKDCLAVSSYALQYVASLIVLQNYVLFPR